MRFASPEFLLLLAAPLMVALAWTRWGRQRPATLRFPALEDLPVPPISGRIKSDLPRWLRIGGLILLALALARPQGGHRVIDRTAEGIDIVLALDTSTSMTAEDFHPENRLRVAKNVIKRFITGRTSDRIGLVVFAGTSFTQCPLTLDYDVLSRFVEEVDFAWDWDGTAMGMAVAGSLSRLKDSEAVSKVIILLTDGVNNRGEIDPITAAQMAEALGIRIYTVGAGTRGEALVQVRDRVGRIRKVRRRVEIDEETLTRLAEITGGLYFRATDAQGLQEIFNRISELETTEVEVREHVNYVDWFGWFLGSGLALILAGAILDGLLFRRVP